MTSERTAQFTPGEWDAGHRTVTVEGSDFTPVDAPERTVAFVPASRSADAHLIAAAPELYEALEDICREFAHGHPLIVRGKSALSKARGGKP
jgi:hypothetical protein